MRVVIVEEQPPKRWRRVVLGFQHVGVSLPEEQIRWLDAQAKALQVNRSMLLRLIIRWAMEHWAERKPDVW